MRCIDSVQYKPREKWQLPQVSSNKSGQQLPKIFKENWSKSRDVFFVYFRQLMNRFDIKKHICFKWLTHLFLERFVFKYYSHGYRYIVPKSSLLLNWDDSRRFCLTLGADLPVLWDRQTELAIDLMLQMAGIGKAINIGLRRDLVTSQFKWVDGSPVEYSFWSGAKPDAGQCSCRFDNGYWDSLSCTGHTRLTVCQQSIEGRN